jgi:predicted hydrolase (HD superfamily)
METELEKICAILHDFPEDYPEKKGSTAKAFAILREEGFSEEVISILQLVTHRKGTDYMDYIRALAVHPVAKKIKIADLRDNSDITRLKCLREKDIDRLHKYMVAYEYLKD